MQDAPITEAGDVYNSKFNGMGFVFLLFSSVINTILFSLLVILFISFHFSCEYLHIATPEYVLMTPKQ